MIGIIDFGSKKTPGIAAVCKKLGYGNRILQWDDCDEGKLKKFDTIILSGAPVLLTEIDYQPYMDRFSFLKEAPVSVLGVCFGHQLIGLLYGSEVFKGVAVRGLTRIEVLKNTGLFNGFLSETNMMEDHTEGIILPKNFVKLASSDQYEVEAMMHISKPIYGVQFHPEVSGREGEKVLNNFLGLLPGQREL